MHAEPGGEYYDGKFSAIHSREPQQMHLRALPELQRMHAGRRWPVILFYRKNQELHVRYERLLLPGLPGP